jgi:hypothetical protein
MLLMNEERTDFNLDVPVELESGIPAETAPAPTSPGYDMRQLMESTRT